MAETVTLQYDVDLRPLIIKTEGFAGAVVAPRLLHKRTLTAGNGTGQINLLYHARFSIAASGTQNIDLDSTLSNIVGTLAAFTKVKALAIANTSDKQAEPTTAAITIAGDWITTIFGANSLWPLDAGGEINWLHRIGQSITAGTGDVITLNNTDGSSAAQVDVLIAGIS